MLSWKTAQSYYSGECGLLYTPLPQSGIALNGNVYKHPTLVSRTKENEFTLLPTPLASDYKVSFSNPLALCKYLRAGHQLRTIYLCQGAGLNRMQTLKLYASMMGFTNFAMVLKHLETRSKSHVPNMSLGVLFNTTN